MEKGKHAMNGKAVFFGIVSAALIAGFCRPILSQEIELARDGRTAYVIVEGKAPTPAESFAARELSAYLRKVTGATFPILSETASPPPARALHVGGTEFALAKEPDAAPLGAEEWVIRNFGENIVLTGGRPRGTLYAVYEFLEGQIGCHWLDEQTEIVPSKPVLSLGPTNLRGAPAFWDRRIYTYIESVTHDHEQIWLFRARNRDSATDPKLGFGNAYGSPGACHTFYYYSKEWPADHPEYLAMNQRGERVVSTSGSGPGQICLTHPDVRNRMLGQLRAFIGRDREKAAQGKYPPPRVYVVEPNDCHWMCQCPNCKAFREREGADSGPLIDLMNELAAGVGKRYPDVLVETFAYSNNIKPPKTVRPRGNVMIRLAQLNAEWAPKDQVDQYPDMFRPMSHPINRPSFDTLLAWSKIAKHMAYWDYWIQYSPNDKFPTPYVNVRCLQPDLKLFRDCGVEMIFVECENVETTSFFALKRWLGLKLMQNPTQDPAPLIQTFMEGFYGPAAAKMEEYLNYMERQIAAVPDSVKLSAMKAEERPYLDLDFIVTSQRLLDEAEALCGGNPAALRHVRRERIPVDAALFCMWDGLEKALPAGRAMPFERKKIIARYEASRLEQMQAFRSKDMLDKGKEDLKKEIRKMRDLAEAGTRKTQPTPRLRVPRLAGADPAQVDWSKAARIEKWFTLLGSEAPERRLSGLLAHDGRRLLILLEEKMDASKLAGRDDIWSGDEWEIFFAPGPGKTPYRQLAVNPDGKFCTNEWKKSILAGGKPEPWESDAVIKSEKGDGWRIFVCLPLDRILPGGVQSGQPFFLNIYRATPSTGEHMTSVPNFESSFHEMKRMAEVTIE